MDDDMEEDEEGGFHGNNNRSPGSQGSAGWEVDQGNLIIHRLLNYAFQRKRQFCQQNDKRLIHKTNA